MCDQDHFEEDRQEAEARGLVTRRQFGALVGVGVAMMLPKVVNAVDVKEQDVTIKTPDGTCDAYFVHVATGTAPAVLIWPDIFGLRPAFRQMGKRLAESGYSVLVVNPFYRQQKAPTASKGCGDADSGADAAGQGAERADAHDRCEGVHRVAGFAGAGRQEPEDRYAGLLHGRPDGVPHGGRESRSRRRRGLVPWRRPGDHGCDQTARTCRSRRPRRRCSSRSRPTTTSSGPTDKDVLKETFAKSGNPAEIEVYSGAHGWCPPDSTVYNMAGCREGVDSPARALRKALT